ncbi:unnamed protein product [Brassica napus]|uniref:(rape) hypothetical protein n=1 Tax=Brassica napus TaxID=3708 RepID=A0A816NU94_BRANA|nr:unnamed protein product [Brassica napus]
MTQNNVFNSGEKRDTCKDNITVFFHLRIVAATEPKTTGNHRNHTENASHHRFHRLKSRYRNKQITLTPELTGNTTTTTENHIRRLCWKFYGFSIFPHIRLSFG